VANVPILPGGRDNLPDSKETAMPRASREVPRPGDEAAFWSRLFWTWLVLRTAFWVILSRLSQPNPPLDLAEMLALGQQWQIGYLKHPPLPTWIAESSFQLFQGDVAGPYLAGYLLTAFCLWAAWRLGRDVLPPRLAFAAVLCLEGLIYFNCFFPSELNHNVVLNACWAGVVLCLFQALRTARLRWWLGLGLAAGLGLVSKYTIGVLFLPLTLYVVASRRGRTALAGAGPWLAALVAALVFAPHGSWVLRHDFTPLRYAVFQTRSTSEWTAHLIRPGYFCLSQGIRLLPVLFVLVAVTSWRWRWRPLAEEQRWQRDFLLVAVLGPVALLVLLGLVLAFNVRDAYGSPLWTFVGVLMLVSVQTLSSTRTLPRLRWHFAAVLLFFVCFALGDACLKEAITGRPRRGRFPGRALAETVARRWQARFGCALPLVSGDPWLAYTVSCQGRHRPTLHLFALGSYELTPWVSDADLRTRGGALLWDAGQLGDDLPALFRPSIAGAQVQPALVLEYPGWHRLPPARIGLAFIPPACQRRAASKKRAR
jgi:hypothetical protein